MSSGGLGPFASLELQLHGATLAETVAGSWGHPSLVRSACIVRRCKVRTGSRDFEETMASWPPGSEVAVKRTDQTKAGTWTVLGTFAPKCICEVLGWLLGRQQGWKFNPNPTNQDKHKFIHRNWIAIMFVRMIKVGLRPAPTFPKVFPSAIVLTITRVTNPVVRPIH